MRLSKDPTYPSEFALRILVVCPDCGKMAMLERSDAALRLDSSNVDRGGFQDGRVTCTNCGYSMSGLYGDYLDKLELWLSIECCGNRLWALNEDHLVWLEDFVAASLRERRRDPAHGWSNSSLASRLPRWITAAENRDMILKAIEKLKTKPG